LLVFAAAKAVGFSFRVPTLPPGDAIARSIYSCVQVPLLEEAPYRPVLCVPLVAVAGSRSTVIAGGPVSAALHFVHGNRLPDNFIAGFFLCWAYLKGGSLVVPMVFDSVGNGFVVVVQLCNWY
jgi:membrane protease YdiL (CAAX protease family)